MKKLSTNIDWAIFKKAAIGQLSPAEDVLFQSWLKSSRANQQYFLKAKAFYQSCDDIKEVDHTAAFEKFERSVSQRKELRLQWIRVAAAAALLMIISGSLAYLIIGTVNSPSFQPVALAPKVFPATGQVMLTLSSGQQVLLKDKSDTLIQEGSTSIKSSKGVVNYLAFGKKNAAVEYNTLSLPRGADYKLVLSDSTIVWLNAESSITYPLNFIGDKRTVSITGEAYFEVSHNEKKPFVVDVAGTKITVLGTKFNVNSYSGNTGVYTTLVQGRVEVYTNTGKAVILSPNEQAFSKNDGNLDVSRVDAAQAIDWVSGRFDFEDQTLETIMDKLSRWYDLDVFYEGASVKNLKFTGYIQRYQDVNELLKLFELTNSVEFYMKGKTIQVRQKR